MKIDPKFKRRLEDVQSLVGDLWERGGFDSELHDAIHRADEAVDDAIERIRELEAS